MLPITGIARQKCIQACPINRAYAVPDHEVRYNYRLLKTLRAGIDVSGPFFWLLAAGED